jgi:hypothetical protein
MPRGFMASGTSFNNITKDREGGWDVLLDPLLRKDFWQLVR